jgi:hypothetical protein
MSTISMTVVRHRGETMTLGRNLAVKMMLEKSSPKNAMEQNRVWQTARELCVRSFLRPWAI